MNAVKQMRLEVKKYIDAADTKVVKMVHAMLEVEKENDWWQNEETLSIVQERSAEYKSVKVKGIPWETAKKQILSLSTILKELENVPHNRLEDIYSFIHSLNANTKKPDSNRKKILSFAGSFSDMPEKDYKDFINGTKQTRKDLFNRDIKS